MAGRLGRYQEFLQEKLGKLEFAVAGDDITVDHKITVCDQEIAQPVLEIHVTDHENLITDELLDLLQKTPEERRAVAKRNEIAGRGQEKAIQRRRGRKYRGIQLKIAYAGDVMTDDSIQQLGRELKTKLERRPGLRSPTSQEPRGRLNQTS